MNYYNTVTASFIVLPPTRTSVEQRPIPPRPYAPSIYQCSKYIKPGHITVSQINLILQREIQKQEQFEKNINECKEEEEIELNVEDSSEIKTEETNNILN